MQHAYDNHTWVSDASQNSAKLLASRPMLCSDPEQAKSMKMTAGSEEAMLDQQV
jgi:hypothetical protein